MSAASFQPAPRLREEGVGGDSCRGRGWPALWGDLPGVWSVFLWKFCVAVLVGHWGMCVC